MEYAIDTRCIHGEGHRHPDGNCAISYPIYQTATFSHRGLGESSGFDYTRQSNPTRQQLERVLASLENGYGALAFSSGMAVAV